MGDRRMNDIVTLDVGTTHTKGYLFSSQGEKLKQVTYPTPFLIREKGFSEIGPEQLLGVILNILNELVNPKAAVVDGIVISGMACSFIPVNRQGKPLYPCICWNDQRNAAYVNHSELNGIEPYLGQYPLPMYLPYRIKWFFENKPDVLSDVYKWLNLTDFILFHLSAQKEFITDYSQASRTMLFNSLTKEWNAPVIDHFKIPHEQLPTPKPSGSVIGPMDTAYQIDPSYRNTQLLLGGHDHMFAALTGGIHNQSIALNSTGTSEALVLPYHHDSSFSFFQEECNLESHVIDNEYFVVGYVASTGSIMQWADRLFHLFKWAGQSDLQSLWKDKMQGLPIFIPSGRRMQPSRKGRFIDLQPSHDDLDLSLSVMEGLSFEAKALLEHLNSKLHIQTDLLRLVGGSSKSIHVLQMKSSILQKPIEVIHDVDMTSLGGYILCGFALNHFDDVGQVATELLNRQKRTLLEPDIKVSKQYESRYHLYLQERGA
jgi:sugar (pentulose or hexulose) kinase